MKKKWLAFLLAGTMALAVGCTQEPNNNDDQGDNGSGTESELVLAPTGAPDYSAYEGEEFPIGAWNPTPANTSYKNYDAMFTYAKEAGINFLCDIRAAQNPGRGDSMLEKCAEHEMHAFVNLSGLTYENDVAEGGNDYFGTEFTQSEYFLGFNFWDEPSTERFASLENSVKAFKEDYPDKLAYINLLPNYATTGQMGADSFADYIQTFVETVPSVDHLSYDFYPLVGQMSGGEVMSHSVWQLWLASLETMANAAKDTGKDLWVFIQCMSFGANNRAPQSAEDITFQNYVNMCFGAKAIQYFCLTTPDTNEFDEYDVAMLDRNLEPTENFDYVKAANEELNTFAYVYNQFTWENVMPVYGSEDSALNTGAFDMLENPIVKSSYFTASADYSVLIGKFHDDNGYNGYMLANYSDPLDYQDANLTMTFNANRLLVFANGTSEVVTLTDGTYTCKLGPGEGRFVIPYNV